VEGDIGDLPGGALQGVDMVVHLVGILQEAPGVSFHEVHVLGTEALLREARKAGVRHFFFQSALGAHPGSDTRYLKTKALAEEAVKASGLPFTIFRPSLLIGPWDGFSLRVIELIRSMPVVPVPGSGRARLQPLYIQDWVRCFLKVLKEGPKNKTYELGGPEQLSYNRILELYMQALGLKKPLLHIPMGLATLGLPLGRLARAAGLKVPQATLEQLRLLQRDNVCAPDAVRRHFGFQPLGLKEALRRFISPPAQDR